MVIAPSAWSSFGLLSIDDHLRVQRHLDELAELAAVAPAVVRGDDSGEQTIHTSTVELPRGTVRIDYDLDTVRRTLTLVAMGEVELGT